MLSYVNGGSIAEEELEAFAKYYIDAADKYSIVNRKLEAEAVYLTKTKLTFGNAMNNLLYADAINCALLKETVLDFLTENSTEAINNKEIPFTDFQEMWSKISWLLLIGARSISVKNATIIAGTVKKVKIIKKMMVKIIV